MIIILYVGKDLFGGGGIFVEFMSVILFVEGNEVGTPVGTVSLVLLDTVSTVYKLKIYINCININIINKINQS